MAVPSKPFRRGRFDELPEQPRLPHGLALTSAREVVVSSRAMGPVRTLVREIGLGPPLLLVHGLMTSSYSWRYVYEALGRRFRVVAPDLPGAGASEKVLSRRYDGDALAEWIVALVDALGIRGCACVGNSMGGYLCMRAALLDAGAFARLVNVHSPGIADARHYAMATGLAVPGMRRALAWWIRRSPLRWAHANVHYFDESLKSLEEAHAYGDPLATREGSLAFVKYLAETFAPADQRAFVRALEQRRAAGRPFPVPLQLVYSREDPLVPPAIGDALKALVPDAQLVRLERTSHFAHVDSPDRLLAPVLEFLSSS